MNESIIHAAVTHIAPLTESILQIELTPETFVPWHAGQYLEVLVGELAMYYSIANAPLGARHYALHVRHTPDNAGVSEWLTHLRETGEVNLRVPLGHCHIECLDPARPVLFIAGGTGFAPIHAMMEQLLATDDARDFALFWSARSQSDLYMAEKVQQWHTHASHFVHVATLADPGRDAMLQSVLSRFGKVLPDWQAVIGGPFDMATAYRGALTAAGMPRERLFSDAFEFEP